ncbi:MAG: DUF1587 domain-containing protein [Acidobacteriia bacterium]|nr:DUF1587 domain-containing protein [Terriglobia bacterium]
MACIHAAVWERVLRQVSTGMMPPAGLPRPGATMPHRMNRAEYSNAIRDLLAVDTKPGALLPVDESGNGFDNMANLLSMSPALLERYMSAARTVSRLAIGDLKMQPGEVDYGTGRGQRKEPNSEDLPFVARGGVAFQHYFPLDAEYEFRVNLPGNPDGPNPAPYKLRAPVTEGLHSVVATFLRESARAEIAAPLRRGAFPASPAEGAPLCPLNWTCDWTA